MLPSLSSRLLKLNKHCATISNSQGVSIRSAPESCSIEGASRRRMHRRCRSRPLRVGKMKSTNREIAHLHPHVRLLITPCWLRRPPHQPSFDFGVNGLIKRAFRRLRLLSNAAQSKAARIPDPPRNRALGLWHRILRKISRQVPDTSQSSSRCRIREKREVAFRLAAFPCRSISPELEFCRHHFGNR